MSNPADRIAELLRKVADDLLDIAGEIVELFAPGNVQATADPSKFQPLAGARPDLGGFDPSPDQLIIARTIWGEARSDGVAGMEAVAAVIRNRVRLAQHGVTWWGRSYQSVALKPAQFSAWNLGDPNRPKMQSVTTADPEFRQALRIAARTIDGTLADPTGGADHYHTVGVSPGWAAGRQPIKRIGSHLFYRLEAGGVNV